MIPASGKKLLDYHCAMALTDYRVYKGRLERAARLIADGKVCWSVVLATKEFTHSSLQRALKAIRSGRPVSVCGRPSILASEEEDLIKEIIRIETISGTSFNPKNIRTTV